MSTDKERNPSKPAIAYRTRYGRAWNATVEQVLEHPTTQRLQGTLNLVLTSPPFPLRTKKKYGNLGGSEYVKWLEALAPKLGNLLAPDGSIVLEIGNCWEKGRPIMSTLPLEALLAFRVAGDFHLCQSFICHNTARLPGPAQWVNVERIRVKDSYTHVWWMSRTERPKADNREVLVEYSDDMRRLLEKKSYNSGRRPSGHVLREGTFLKDNGGAIPANVLNIANTGNYGTLDKKYLQQCKTSGLKPHPARMQPGLAEFFIKFLTTEGDLVFDPFGGSNTTGAVAEQYRRKWIVAEPIIDYLRTSTFRFNHVRTTPNSVQWLDHVK